MSSQRTSRVRDLALGDDFTHDGSCWRVSHVGTDRIEACESQFSTIRTFYAPEACSWALWAGEFSWNQEVSVLRAAADIEPEVSPRFSPRFRTVELHFNCPAVVHGGRLVDNCPTVESADRLAAALNALAYDADLHWAIPEMSALTLDEVPRAMRALAKMVRMGQR